MSLLFSAPFAVRLKEQLAILRDLNGLYDGGSHFHALSLAGRISVILEMLSSAEGGKHIVAEGISFTTPIDPLATGRSDVAPLVSKRIYVDDNMTIVSQANLPIFTDANQPASFRCNLGKWVSQPAFYYEPGKFISRQRLIALMRNKDGAGHPYSLVPPEYVSFAQDAGALSLRVSQPGAPEPQPAIHLASVRQISHELLDSLSPSA